MKSFKIFLEDKTKVTYSYDVLNLNTIKLETIKKLKINSLALVDGNVHLQSL